MTEIFIAIAVSTFVCSIYTFILPTYDWYLARRAEQDGQSNRSTATVPGDIVTKPTTMR